MSYRIKPHGQIGLELQRVAAQEAAAIERNLETISCGGERAAEDAVHDARKHCKKLRAVLQLLREPLGAKQMREEIKAFRDIGRAFRQLRDAQALTAALDSLAARFFETRRPAAITAARRILAAEERAARAALIRKGRLKSLSVLLRAARDRFDRWDFGDFRWKDLLIPLGRSYRAARGGWRGAKHKSEAKILHEWRRRTKDLGYHLSLIHSAAPDFLEEWCGELEILSEFLGDDHDLYVLRGKLEGQAQNPAPDGARKAFFDIIDLRRSELQDAALDLGERVFGDTPAEFIACLDARRDEHRRIKKKCRKAQREMAVEAGAR